MPNYGGESSGASDTGGGNYGSSNSSGGGGNSWNSRESTASRNRNTGLTGDYWSNTPTTYSGSGGRTNSWTTRSTQTAAQKAAATEAARVKAIADKRADTGLIETNWENGGIELTDALRGNYGKAVNDPDSSWATSADNVSQQNLANSSLMMSQAEPRNSWDNVETTQTNNFPMSTTWGDIGHGVGKVGGFLLGGTGGSLVGGGLGGLLGGMFDSREEAPENSWERDSGDGGFLGTGINEQDRALQVQDDPENWASRTFSDAAGMLGGAVTDALGVPGLGIPLGKLAEDYGGWYGDQIYDTINQSIENGTYGPANFTAENNYGLGVGGGRDDSTNVGFGSAATSNVTTPTSEPISTSFKGSPRYSQEQIPEWLRDLYKGGSDGSEMQSRINPWRRG